MSVGLCSVRQWSGAKFSNNHIIPYLDVLRKAHILLTFSGGFPDAFQTFASCQASILVPGDEKGRILYEMEARDVQERKYRVDPGIFREL